VPPFSFTFIFAFSHTPSRIITMAFIRTALLTLLAATTLALSMPVRRSTPVRRDFTGTASPFDPVSGDDCGCGLDENAQAIKVPLSTVCVPHGIWSGLLQLTRIRHRSDITPTSPLCECIVAGDASTGGDVVCTCMCAQPTSTD
jgi:hypothetical protein